MVILKSKSSAKLFLGIVSALVLLAITSFLIIANWHDPRARALMWIEHAPRFVLVSGIRMEESGKYEILQYLTFQRGQPTSETASQSDVDAWLEEAKNQNIDCQMILMTLHQSKVDALSVLYALELMQCDSEIDHAVNMLLADSDPLRRSVVIEWIGSRHLQRFRDDVVQATSDNDLAVQHYAETALLLLDQNRPARSIP